MLPDYLLFSSLVSPLGAKTYGGHCTLVLLWPWAPKEAAFKQ